MEQNKILFIIGIMTMFSCHSIHKTMESGNGQLSNSEIIQLLTDDSVKYWIGVNFGSSFKFAREGLRFNSYLNSNHREVNRQYYPTEQLRQSNAIKKNDSTHKA
jgi:hypothetical protein